MKLCKRCKVSKAKEEFHKNLRQSDGVQSVCKTCRKQMDSVRYKTSNKRDVNLERKKKLLIKVQELKSSVGCSTCPEKDYRCLDYHHLDPTNKVDNVAQLVGQGVSWVNILKEIKKCIVLCANCHRKLHVQ